MIVYADGDKRKADAIKDDVVILPAEQYFDELSELEMHRAWERRSSERTDRVQALIDEDADLLRRLAKT